jgi:hypothetical protein
MSMVEKKELIFLTNIMLHVREQRPTYSYSKVAEKGRMYFPIENTKTESGTQIKDGADFSLTIPLPQDLMDRVNKGEAILMMPKGGIPVFAGQDTREFVERMNRKERRELIHRSRPNPRWKK